MKKALEAFWAGKEKEDALLATAAAVEAEAWSCQAQAGIDLIGLDGTLYDHILDFTFYLGLIPERFLVRPAWFLVVACVTWGHAWAGSQRPAAL